MLINKGFYFVGFILVPHLLIANAPSPKSLEQAKALIQEQMQFDTQKEKFHTNIAKEVEEKKIYETEQIVVEADKDEIECFEIETINIRGMTLFDQALFNELKEPYLKNCNGMANLTNLLNKISNRYIDKGYVTSRAYLKQQDLSDGVVDIDILEGKIEKIEFANTKPLDFMGIYEGEILNLRDLEVELQQRDRLKSMDYNIELLPGTKVGYSIVKIVAHNTNSPFYGNLSTNNFGSYNTGKYQMALSTNYENLFGLSDIVGVNINTTNNVFKEHNFSQGIGISYSIPMRKFLFDISYFYSKFDILSKDEFSHDVITFGNANTLSLKGNYKLYHGQNHSVELSGGYNRKQNKNYLTIFIEDDNANLISNTTSLAQQSYILASAFLGAQYSYQKESTNAYMTLNIIRGLSAQSTISREIQQHTEYTKYELFASFSKRFAVSYEPTYNFSFTGQMVDSDVLATDEISIGGPYSVRGFNKAGIAGEKGFFIRNDFSLNHNLDQFRLSPYLGIDYGYIAHFQDYTQKADIVGSAFGLKTNYKNASMDVFYHRSLQEDTSIEELNSNFFGFTFNLNF